MPPRPRCKFSLLVETPALSIPVPFIFLISFLARTVGIEPAHLLMGDSQKQVHPLCVRISNPPGKRVPDGAAAATAYRFCSWTDRTGHFYAHAAAHPFPSIPCGCVFCGNGSPVLHRALTERRTLLYSTIPLCRPADFLTVPASMENSTRHIQGPALLAALNA